MTDFPAIAKRQISYKGISATLYRFSSATPVTNKPWETSENAFISESIKIVLTSFKITEIDGTLVKKGDRKGIVYFTNDITTKDYIVANNKKYFIISIEIIEYKNSVVLYKLQLRE